MAKTYTRRMIEEWARHSPGVTVVAQGEGVLDTPEKVQAYKEHMEEVMKSHPKPGLLPSCKCPCHRLIRTIT